MSQIFKRRAKRLLLWIVGVPIAVAGVIAILQVIYALMPEPSPTPIAQEMKTKAAPFFKQTDAGYYALGLLAPAGADPLVFGKCVQEVVAKKRAALLATNSSPETVLFAHINEIYEAHERDCANNRPGMGLPTNQSRALFDWGVVELWGKDEFVSAELIGRVKTLAQMGAVGHGDYVSEMLGYRRHSAISAAIRHMNAKAGLQWARGDRIAAAADIKENLIRTMSLGQGKLVDLMTANASTMHAISTIYLLASRSTNLSAQDADALNSALNESSNLVRLLLDSFAVEHESFEQLMRGAMHSAKPSLSDSLVRAMWKNNDVTNQRAYNFDRVRTESVSAPRALRLSQRRPTFSSGTFCEKFDDASLFCLAFFPNPMGRLMGSLGEPVYAPYAVRIYETLTLANAVRLAIAVKRNALSNEALANFVRNAPPEMRNPFTELPFELDVSTAEIVIPRYAKGGGLSDGTVYRLKL